MDHGTVLVVGAGIAGCTAAHWLTERGFSTTVVERAPTPRPGGQAVDLRGAGRVVIDRMGLLGRVRERELDQRGIAYVDHHGRRRAEMPVEAFGGRGLVSSDEILRGDLNEVLYEATQDRAEYLFDDTVTVLENHDDGVDVFFESATPRRFDLVVGADGVNSTVRRLSVDPDSTGVQPVGLLTAWFTIPAEIALDGWYLMYNAPGGRVVSVRPGRLPGEHKASVSVRGYHAGDRHAVAAQREMVVQQMAGAGWEADRVVRHARYASDFHLQATSRVVLERWHHRRVVLVGDAAYCPTPLTGMGTSLAVVGAYMLAGELAAAGAAGWSTALGAYERRLRPYVTRGQELPPMGIEGYAPSRPWRVRAVWASMRWANRWPMRPIMERVLGAADAVDLPDYPTSTTT